MRMTNVAQSWRGSKDFTCITRCVMQEHYDGRLGIDALKARKMSKVRATAAALLLCLCLFVKSNEGLGSRFALSSANENLMKTHPDGLHSKVGNEPVSHAG